jgi:hypothetical protein
MTVNATVNMKSYILVAFIVLVLAAFADADTDEQFSADTIEIDFTVTMYQTVSQMGRWTDYDGRKALYRSLVAKLLDIDTEQVLTTVTWLPVHKDTGRNTARMVTVVVVPSNKVAQTRKIIQGWIDDVPAFSHLKHLFDGTYSQSYSSFSRALVALLTVYFTFFCDMAVSHVL